MAPLVGREAIGKLHQTFLDQFAMDAKGPAVDVRVVGDLAVAYGTYAETITPKDGTLAAEKASGHWMASFQRQADGAWKWDWVMANSDQPTPGTTADGAEEQALLQIERDFATAALARDMAFFERTLATEYAQVADGKPVNVAAQLAELKAGRVQIESITMRDMRAHVVGDAAIVSMMAESKGTDNGKPFDETSTGIDFFVKRDGRWQLVNSQMTTIKTP
jgi:ketosteroid isomerase-like protein